MEERLFMDFINGVMSFVMSDGGWATILGGLAAVHGLALFIVNLTATPEDDKWVGKIYGYIEYAAGIIHPNAKLLPGEDKIAK